MSARLAVHLPPHLAALIPAQQDRQRDNPDHTQHQQLIDGLTEQQRQWWTDQQQRRPHRSTRSADEGLSR